MAALLGRAAATRGLTGLSAPVPAPSQKPARFAIYAAGMPSSARSTTRRSPRPAPRPRGPVPSRGSAGRPLLVPFAAVFGLLVAVECGYLTWLLSVGWYLAVPLLLGVAAATGAVLVWLGRRRGWLLLAIAAALLLLALLALAVLFAVLGGGTALWSTVLLLAGPVGCLAFAPRHSVRSWRGPGPSPGGRRTGAPSR